jgi:hypothetical protein
VTGLSIKKVIRKTYVKFAQHRKFLMTCAQFALKALLQGQDLSRLPKVNTECVGLPAVILAVTSPSLARCRFYAIADAHDGIPAWLARSPAPIASFAAYGKVPRQISKPMLLPNDLTTVDQQDGSGKAGQ